MLKWVKSSLSGPNGNCVEVAGMENGSIAVRNSKLPQAAHLYFTTPEWRAFTDGVKKGEFDEFGKG